MKLLYFILSLSLVGCVTPKPTTVSFSSDVKVIDEGKNSNLAKGEAIVLSSEPVFLQNENSIPVILLPVSKNAESVSLDLSVLDNVYEEKKVAEYGVVDKELGQAMSSLIVVYGLIYKKEYAEALKTIDSIPNSNQITYLNLVRSSIYFTMGDLKKAKFHFALVEKKFPDDKNVLEFRKVLGYE